MSIRKYPDKILDQLSISAFENLEHNELISLTEEMREACWNVGGFGISAIQIGKPFRVFAYISRSKKDLEWVCDPELISASGRIYMHEGCLSIPGYFWSISRHQKVTIEFKDLSGKKRIKTLDSIESRVVQHEMDHLDGITIPDLMSSPDRKIFEENFFSGKDVYGYNSPKIFVP